MCSQTEPAVPSNTAQALAMVRAGLGYLASCDAGELGTSAQVEALIGLEQAEAQHTVARAKMLAAFSARQGHHADGQYGPAAWLRAFTRVTNGAATGAVKWARRVAAHPVIAGALAAGQLSVSWGRTVCEWTDQLPQDRRADADTILLAAAQGGAGLADLAALAEQMIQRSRTTPDTDRDRFTDRAVWLETTIGGAGRLTGDLTGPAAAAVTVVLDALSGRTGPEDTRSLPQRRHDGLQEACQRLIDSGMLPGDGASQAAQVSVHVDLAELRGLGGGSGLEAGWSAARAAAAGLSGSVYLTGPDADAAACDAALTPIVTGHIDWNVLDQLTAPYLDTNSHRDSPGAGTGQDTDPAQDAGPGAGPGESHRPRPDPDLLHPQTRERLQHTLLEWSIDLLSGPAGFPAYLRGHLLPARFTSLSQPLDLGRTTRVIPPHLRKAVIQRDKKCRFPGCEQPPSTCQVHHLIPWAKGGATTLGNLALFCRFHHVVVIHRWGWKITCHPDGTTIATSPDGRVLHSHGPPGQAALGAGAASTQPAVSKTPPSGVNEKWHRCASGSTSTGASEPFGARPTGIPVLATT